MEKVCPNQPLLESFLSIRGVAEFTGGRITSDAGILLL
jgi:hypothetical protein